MNHFPRWRKAAPTLCLRSAAQAASGPIAPPASLNLRITCTRLRHFSRCRHRRGHRLELAALCLPPPEALVQHPAAVFRNPHLRILARVLHVELRLAGL
eukprot:9500222-Pyramimonas_sp.AAC.1